MKIASAISAGLHAAVLLWALISFSGKTFEVTPAESLPVDIISEKQLSEITKGNKDAPKLEMPKPLAEKKDEPKPIVEDIKAKVTEKKPAPAAAEKQAAPPETKPDPIADKLKKTEEKPQETKNQKPPEPQKKPAPQPKFDADKIAALLDKRDPTRNPLTGPLPGGSPSLGRVNGTATQLSQREIDALRRRISECWQVPAGAESADKMSVVFRVIFHPDGTIAAGPDVVSASASAFGPAFADSGRRAILQCQPYTMLKRETYDAWKDMEIQFSPSDMFRG
jgi:outer membrane biosynthesis protein TonB